MCIRGKYGNIWEYSREILGKIGFQKELSWNLPSGYVKIAIENGCVKAICSEFFHEHDDLP